MDAEELLKIAKATPPKEDGRNVWAHFRPAAFVLRDKGYLWPEIAQKFVEAGEEVPNIESFCASMSRDTTIVCENFRKPPHPTKPEAGPRLFVFAKAAAPFQSH